jgi:hypothetical protein
MDNFDLKATYARIGEFINSHQSETYGQIAGTLGLSRSQVARIARLQGIKRCTGKRASALEAAIAVIEATRPKPGRAPAGDVATPPKVESICAAPDAPTVEAALSVTTDTPSVETAVM